MKIITEKILSRKIRLMRKIITKIRQYLDYKKRGIKVYGFWTATNIYPTAKIGDNVQIGWGCEIGNAIIEHDVRIGAFCFIPEGVTIRHHVFIGPHFCGTNDRFPPSDKDKWEKTEVKAYGRIGAGVIVICGNTIGIGALVGAGSVVTKNIPDSEIWTGIPAKKLKMFKDTKVTNKPQP